MKGNIKLKQLQKLHELTKQELYKIECDKQNISRSELHKTIETLLNVIISRISFKILGIYFISNKMIIGVSFIIEKRL